MMKRLDYLTAGESHGPALTAILSGLPAGFKLDMDKLDIQVKRRKKGFGRGGRMKIESDAVQILSGLRNSHTLGSPLTLQILNKDFINWKPTMDPVSANTAEKLTLPRPGHADYAGMLKYKTDDLRNILERSSARETAIRNAVGAICRQFLEDIGIHLFSRVIQIGTVKKSFSLPTLEEAQGFSYSDINCTDSILESEMINEIKRAMKSGDSLGGVFQILIYNLPVGLGSHTHWDERLSSKISAQIMGLNAIKGIEFGQGFNSAALSGSIYHDEFDIQNDSIIRKSNNAGGLEGGMTNGELLYFNAVMKPIPTLAKPLQSIDMLSKKAESAHKERTDSCAVPAASIIAENITAIPILDALLLKFGGDSWEEFKNNYSNR